MSVSCDKTSQGNAQNNSVEILLPSGIPATQSDTERALLGKLETCFFDSDCAEALLRLARYYNQAQRNDVATAVLQMIIGLSDDAETKGLRYLDLQQIAEKKGRQGTAPSQRS